MVRSWRGHYDWNPSFSYRCRLVLDLWFLFWTSKWHSIFCIWCLNHSARYKVYLEWSLILLKMVSHSNQRNSKGTTTKNFDLRRLIRVDQWRSCPKWWSFSKSKRDFDEFWRRNEILFEWVWILTLSCLATRSIWILIRNSWDTEINRY